MNRPYRYFALLSALLPASLSAAITVNADFSRDISANNVGSNPPPILYTSTGPAPDAGTIWNDLQIPLAADGDATTDPSVAHPVQFNNLTSSTGVGTTVNIQFTSGFFRSFNGAPPLPTDPGALQGDRVFARSGEVATLTIQGLNPLSFYDLYFINSAFVTGYTINSVTKVASGTAYDGSWTEGAEFALQGSIAPDASGNIVVTIQDSEAPITGFGVISGLQIVEVPEPSAACLLLSTVAGFAFRRSRSI